MPARGRGHVVGLSERASKRLRGLPVQSGGRQPRRRWQGRREAQQGRVPAVAGAAATGWLVSGRSNFAISMPGTSGASAARRTACSKPSAVAAANTVDASRSASTYPRSPASPPA